MQLPDDFVSRVIKEFPEKRSRDICQAIAEGDHIFVMQRLRERASEMMSAAQIMHAIDSGNASLVRQAAADCVRRQELYREGINRFFPRDPLD